jgi:glycosyltransferase involved in cell wall biosynthesis
MHRKIMTLVENDIEVKLFAAYHKNFDFNLWQNVILKRIRLFSNFMPLRMFQFFLRSLIWLMGQKATLFISYDVYALLPLRIKKAVQNCNYIYDSVELFLEIDSLTAKKLRTIFWKIYERLGISGASSSFTVCESDAIHLQKTYPFIKKPDFVRNIPVPADFKNLDYLRQKFELPQDLKTGIYQGMVFKGRGLEHLVEALLGIGNFALFVVGDGPFKPYLIRKVRELGVQNNIYFINAVPFHELYKFTASADIGFTTIASKGLSYYHALPNKLFEYIQACIPVIGSNYPEIKKIVEGEKIGYTVQPDNPQEIREAILKMLDDSNYNEFKSNLKKIKHKYTWSEESKKYLKIVNKALSFAENRYK